MSRQTSAASEEPGSSGAGSVDTVDLTADYPRLPPVRHTNFLTLHGTTMTEFESLTLAFPVAFSTVNARHVALL